MVSLSTPEAEFMNVKFFPLKFLGRILRVLKLEVFVYSIYKTNQFQIAFAQGGGGTGESFR
jgi:hypothetical protein